MKKSIKVPRTFFHTKEGRALVLRDYKEKAELIKKQVTNFGSSDIAFSMVGNQNIIIWC